MLICELLSVSLLESFVGVHVASMGIENMVDRADENLPNEAANAIEYFVGHAPNARNLSNGEVFGAMQSNRLEDAYSSTPSPNGALIRKQLTNSFGPIKSYLKSKFGNTIVLYRAQEPLTGEKNERNTLSWSSDFRIAATFAGVDGRILRLKPITDEQIKKALDTYNQTGKVSFLTHSYVRTDIPTNDTNLDEFYYDIYNKNGEYITDGDDLEQQFEDDQKTYQEIIDNREQKLKRIVKADIPIDDIIWITHRAGQSEFILHNKPGKSGYINSAGKIAKG